MRPPFIQQVRTFLYDTNATGATTDRVTGVTSEGTTETIVSSSSHKQSNATVVGVVVTFVLFIVLVTVGGGIGFVMYRRKKRGMEVELSESISGITLGGKLGAGAFGEGRGVLGVFDCG